MKIRLVNPSIVGSRSGRGMQLYPFFLFSSFSTKLAGGILSFVCNEARNVKLREKVRYERAS